MKQEIQNRINQINRGIVPEGYKETNFGIFPNDWDNKTFGELFTFSGGLGKSREELGENGICYLHYGDMHKNSDMRIVNYSDYENMPKYDIQLKGNEKYLMEDGDVVFVDASEDIPGTSRAVVINNPENKPFISGLHTILAKEKDSLIQKEYKQYLTCPQYIKKQFAKYQVGFKVYGVNTNSMALFTTYYPNNASEQSKIAEVLMACDKAVELQKQYIDKLELRKKAYNDMNFSEGEENYLFKDLYINAGEGGTPSTKEQEYYVNGNIPFVKIEDLEDKYIWDVKSKITEQGLKSSSAWLVPKNSIIFSNGATIGAVSINKIPVTTKQGILGIVPKSFIKVEYLYYLMSSNRFLNKVKRITTKGTMFTAYLKDINKIKVFIPNLEEQQKIVDILSALDKQIELEKQKLQLLEKRQKSLQQLLLTGIVRVI